MGKVSIIIRLEANSKENGSTTRNTDMELLNMLMETDMRATGRTGKGLIREFMSTATETYMKVSGETILRKDRAN